MAHVHLATSCPTITRRMYSTCEASIALCPSANIPCKDRLPPVRLYASPVYCVSYPWTSRCTVSRFPASSEETQEVRRPFSSSLRIRNSRPLVTTGALGEKSSGLGLPAELTPITSEEDLDRILAEAEEKGRNVIIEW